MKWQKITKRIWQSEEEVHLITTLVDGTVLLDYESNVTVQPSVKTAMKVVNIAIQNANGVNLMPDEQAILDNIVKPTKQQYELMLLTR